MRRSRRMFLNTLALAALAGCGGGAPEAAPAPVAAVYGDSISSGTHSTDYFTWQPAVWSPTPVAHIAALAGAEAIDYSYNGASCLQASIRNDTSTLVVIRFGVADTVYGTTPEVFGSHITRLVGEARALGKRVLLTGLTHTAADDTAPLNAVMRECAQALGVPFVDVYAIPFNAATDLADPLHPGEGYSRRVGEVVAGAIRDAVALGT